MLDCFLILKSTLILSNRVYWSILILILAIACSTSYFKGIHFYIDQTRSNSAYYDELFSRIEKLGDTGRYVIISCDEDQLHNQFQQVEVSCQELNEYSIDRIVIDERGGAVLVMARVIPDQNYSITIQQIQDSLKDTITNRNLYKNVPGTGS